MKINTKCSVAIHALIVIASFSHRLKMTSEAIAESTGHNPVVIRNILGRLKQAGLITVPRGTGGAELARDPADITIWDIYRAVDPDSLQNLMGIHPNPNPVCPVGKRINNLLDEPYCAIKDAVQGAMSGYTLADMLERYERSRAEDRAQRAAKSNTPLSE